MKAREMLNKWPMQFLVWDLNEDTNLFYAEMGVIEENADGQLLDPWGQKLNLRNAKKVFNASGDTILEFRFSTEFQSYPVELSIINE